MRRILIPLDDSHATPKVVNAVLDIASVLDSRLCLLHVADIDSVTIGYDLESAIGREETARLLRQDHQWLLAVEKELRERGLDVTAVLRRGEVVPEILRAAERLRPSLIIMGSHGHSALHHLLLGSVSSGVLHAVSCPVLIIPTRKVAAAG